MSKRIQVLGVEIDNHTVREMMFLLEEYVNSDGLNLVGVVSTELLVAASEHAGIKELVDQMDMHVIGDIAILEVLEEVYAQQANELQKRELEEVFLNALIRKRRTIYWISDSQSDLQILHNYMAEHYPKLNIAGSYTGQLEEDSLDSVINEINSVAPDVILLQTASLEKMERLIQSKNQLNTKLCICMGYKTKSKYWSPNRNSKIKSLIDQTVFKRKAIRYQMNRGE